MALLEVAGVSVRFGGVQALDSVDLTVEPGVVTGLIGPNGAGKTTTFNVVTGLQAPSAGHVRLDGTDITNLKPHKRARLGLARTFQRLEVFGSLSARDNLKVGAEIRGKTGDARSPDMIADEMLARVGLTHVAHERVDAMPTGMARLVELGRALATSPRVLLLDEPSSGLNEEESDELGALLLELAEEGLGILLVEHDVELVMRVCSTIHVLDFGRILAVGKPAEIQADPQVQAAYLGLDGADAHPTAKAKAKGKKTVAR